VNTLGDCATVVPQATSEQSNRAGDSMLALKGRLKSVQGPNATIGTCATRGFWYEVKQLQSHRYPF
jgi:hypothetical protein